jgi:hypothetical protein
MDAYLYMRFLKMLCKMTFVGAIITWPVLFPVNATGGGGESGLDIISFSNVNSPTRYFAHAVIAWIFFGWVMFLIARETLYLVKIRQAYLLSTWQASRISQRTVLFTNVPEKQLSLDSVHTMFSGVAQAWLVSDVKDLEDDVKELEETIPKLEKSELKFMKKVNKKQNKSGGEKEASHDNKLRPTHRLKFLIGKKVDSIEHYRRQINELLPKIKSTQRSHISGKEELLSAVFIEFDTLAAAQAAATQHEHRWPTTEMETRQMGVLPEEIVWDNLGMGSKTRFVKKVLATLAISLLIIFWAIPVAIVGIISNVSYLTENVPFLAWIDNIPPVILGVVTGLLPTILLAVLMALVPVICRCKSFPSHPTLHISNTPPTSLRKTRRRHHSRRNRTADAILVLRLPSDPSLPRHNLYIRRHSRRKPDRQQPRASRPPALKEPSKGIEFLHCVLHPVRRRQRVALLVQSRRPPRHIGLE